MLLRKGIFVDIQGKNGLNVRQDTEVCSFNPARKMKIEVPVRMQGGRIQSDLIGGFSYFNINVCVRLVNSIGRFCAIGPNVQIGGAEHSVQSISSNIIFPNWDSDWSAPFCEYVQNNEKMISTIRKKQHKEIILRNNL